VQKYHAVTIRDKYIFLISVLYLLSGTIVWGGSREARQDIWLVMLVNAVIFMTVAGVYSVVHEKYPGKNLFELFFCCLPKPLSYLFGFGYLGYAILIGAISWWNFSRFTSLLVLPELPQYIAVFALAAVCVFCVKQGIRTLAHFASFLFPFVCLILIITMGLSIKQLDFHLLLPVYYDPASFWSGTFTMTAYPFGDIVLLFAVYGAMEKRSSKGNSMVGAVACAFGILALIMVRNAAILGVPILNELNYATYHAMGVIGLEDFFKRIEILLTAAVIFCDVVKGSVVLLFICQGIKHLFSASDETISAIPAAFLMAGLALILFETNADLNAFLYRFRYISLPLQVFGPGLCLLIGLRANKMKKTEMDSL